MMDDYRRSGKEYDQTVSLVMIFWLAEMYLLLSLEFHLPRV